jgi:hypothetical protein
MILMVAWSVAILSGFLAIPYFAFDLESFYVFGRIHGVFSRVGAGVIVVHILQHLGQIRSYFGLKKRPKQDGGGV